MNYYFRCKCDFYFFGAASFYQIKQKTLCNFLHDEAVNKFFFQLAHSATTFTDLVFFVTKYKLPTFLLSFINQVLNL